VSDRHSTIALGPGTRRPAETLIPCSPLALSDRFGTDVSQYFHFMFHSKSFFMFLFVINLSNIIVNIEGEGQTFSWFTMHTLGNTASDGVLAKGGHSYAVMEFLTAGCMVAYLFFVRGEMETI
jgi:hypothetical protein|tara:strand:+ start:144 stop:512 length:369 start_codon:yes stop_codon:yes gene_type:complete